MLIVVVTANGYMRVIINREKTNIRGESSNTISFKLTFASLHALKPPVINVSVAGTSAVLVPGTAGSATTDSTGFLKRTAL